MFTTSPISAAFHEADFSRLFHLACLCWTVPKPERPAMAERLVSAVRTTTLPSADVEEIASALLRLAHRHLSGR